MRLGKDKNRAADQPPQVDSRKALHKPITVLKKDAEGPKTFFGYAKNISCSGMMIGATSPRKPGCRFQLEIPLPTPIGLVVTCDCEVVWQRPWAKNGRHEPGMGLRFLDLPQEVATAIDDWIRTEALLEQLWN